MRFDDSDQVFVNLQTARQADPAIKIEEIKKQHSESTNARRSVVRKKTKKGRSEATKARRTVIRAARKPRMVHQVIVSS